LVNSLLQLRGEKPLYWTETSTPSFSVDPTWSILEQASPIRSSLSSLNMSFRSHLVSSIAVGLVVGCGQPDDSAGIGSLAQPIVNGERTDATDDAVVYVYTDVPGTPEDLSCSGTLIAPNLVATALHCVTNKNLDYFSCNPDGSVDENVQGGGTIGALVPAASIQIFAGGTVGDEPAALGTQIFSTRSTQVCRNDFALVVLDRSLDLPVASVRLEGAVAWGDYVRVLGYGQTEKREDDTYRYVREEVRIVDVGPDSDGDATRTAAPRTFVVGEGPCHGDSGGPAFSEATGALLGVYSLSGALDCEQLGVRNVYTRLQPFSQLVLDAFEAAGAEPILEAGTAAPASTEADSGCTLARVGQSPSWKAAWLLTLGLVGLRRARRA
jgi:Trypsin